MYIVISTSRFLCIYSLLIIGLTRKISADNVIIDCSFDEDFCGWTHDIKYGFNWTRHSGATKTDNTGPPRDHTSEDGEGSYIYIESSESKTQSKTARLLSPEIDSGCYNVQFWYHMYGWGIGTLKVNCEPKCNGLESKNDRGDQWKQATINVSVEQEFRFVIEATTKRSSLSGYGDIAVDDFHVTRLSCSIDVLLSTTLPTIISTESEINVSTQAKEDENFSVNITSADKSSEIGLSLMYIIMISAGAGGFVALVTMIVLVVCLCRRTKRNRPVNNINTSSRDTDTPDCDGEYNLPLY